MKQFYTAPTLIRSLMGAGAKHVEKHDRSSLRVLGTVGEPINPEAWRWYFEVRCMQLLLGHATHHKALGGSTPYHCWSKHTQSSSHQSGCIQRPWGTREQSSPDTRGDAANLLRS